jgi:hypothetical protein
MPANTAIIQLKRSNTAFSVPAVNTLAPGELAVNLTDGRLFLQLIDGKVVDISSTPVGNTFYVSTTGNDIFDGKTPGASKATVRAAVAAAQPGDSVYIHSGTYTEVTPIIIPQQVQICGAGERNTIIQPVDPTKDIFWMNNNAYVTAVKFANYSASAIAFPDTTIETGNAQSASTNTIVLAASSINLNNQYTSMEVTITSGTGSGQVRTIIDYVGNTRTATVNTAWSVVPNSTSNYKLSIPLRTSPAFANTRYTTYITGSPYIYNSSSITSIGGTGLKIDGSRATGNKSMISSQFTQVNQGGVGVHILNDGYSQLVSIYGIFCDVAFLAESGGSASMGNCNVNFGNRGLVANGKGALAMTATLNGTQAANNNTLNVRSIVANSAFVTSTVPFSTMVMKIVGDNDSTFYTVNSATPLDANGNSTVTFVTSNTTVFASGTQVNFYQQSQLRASGQTFEFVGAGTNISAIPRLGGVANSANQITTIAEGAVYATSTDEQGNFAVGDLILNQGTATISGRTFTKSLFAVMTPYILALEG